MYVPNDYKQKRNCPRLLSPDIATLPKSKTLCLRVEVRMRARVRVKVWMRRR
jgi:hypothetical protein